MGGALFLLPALSEMYVPAQLRLLMGFLLTINITPQLLGQMPAWPDSAVGLALYFGAEVTIGVSIGLICSIALSALHTLGVIIATQSGLGTASLFDASQSAQSTVFGTFIGIAATVLMLSLDIHNGLFNALVHSYDSLPIGGWAQNYDDIINGIIRTATVAFATGVKMAAPFIVVISLLFLGSGILSRLMPQFQVFFIILPAQILISFLLLLGISSLLMWFAGHYAGVLNGF